MGGMGEVMLRSAGMSLEFSKWLLPGLLHFFFGKSYLDVSGI